MIKVKFYQKLLKIKILKFTLFVCGREKTFLGQYEHQNKLLGTYLDTWACLEGNGGIRQRTTQFLIAKT